MSMAARSIAALSGDALRISVRDLSRALSALFVIVLAASLSAAEPLVSFDFESSPSNAGSLGGAARLHTYAAGDEPLYGFGPFGRNLDLTAASRHGGITPQDPPAGAAALYGDPALDALESFTLVLWARQNPLVQGVNARLLHKPGAWDLIPHSSGVSLSLGPDASKVSYPLTGGPRLDLTSTWCFFAVAVTPQTVSAFVGSRQQPLASAGEKPRSETFAAKAADLILGNLGGIRPFNGWLDKVRIYSGALDEPALRALFESDLAAAHETAPPLVTALARPPASTPRFQLPPSAIPFSTRWQKRENAPDVMQSFHATHCLWVYGFETDFINRVKSAGLFYQGTLNGLQGQSHSTTNRMAQGDPSGRHEDLDGNKNTPHWMVTFGPRTFTGCCNHPAFRKLFFADAEKLVRAGVDSIHVDDWEMNASWVRHAGICFCEACRSGFREWLQSHCTPEELKALGVGEIAVFDYREHLKANGVPDAATYRQHYRQLPLTPQFADFQIHSMRRFYQDFRKQLDTWSPDTYIPVSVNGLLTPLRTDRVLYGVDVVDFLQGESSQRAAFQTAADFLVGAEVANAVGITQVISPIPRSTARTRAAIATTYALGQPHLVPWDLYMGSDATGSQPRYFGTREQYGDLYDFIHGHRDLLDGYVPAGEIGILVNGDQPCDDLQAFSLKLAAQQIPFHIILGASRYARIPVSAVDLQRMRLIVEFSPVDSFGSADQAVLQAARASALIHFVPAAADPVSATRLLELDLLRVEGPENLYAFPRVNPDRQSTVIHVVNWNLSDATPERAETYQYVTVSLLHPARWGAVAQVLWHEPGREPSVITPEVHPDGIRLTLPQVGTWGIIEIKGIRLDAQL